eukprot:jgi/Mesen1/8770/ME000524S08070
MLIASPHLMDISVRLSLLERTAFFRPCCADSSLQLFQIRKVQKLFLRPPNRVFCKSFIHESSNEMLRRSWFDTHAGSNYMSRLKPKTVFANGRYVHNYSATFGVGLRRTQAMGGAGKMFSGLNEHMASCGDTTVIIDHHDKALRDAAGESMEENIADSTVASAKRLGSSKLNRWARVRQSRAMTRKREVAEENLEQQEQTNLPAKRAAGDGTMAVGDANAPQGGASRDGDLAENLKGIFLVSDGTGWTADHAVHAALSQFEHCFVDQGCDVTALQTHMYSQVNDVERLLDIIRGAGEEGALVVYTLAEPSMREAAEVACAAMSVPYVDMMGPILDAVATHLNVTPMGLPRGAPGRKSSLTQQYFKRIEAVEFTIRQDDGALPKNLHQADIVLCGVSRTSKTPLSTYMAQKGYKVANVPLVLGIDPPKELFEIDQSKIFGLTINPQTLQAIRVARYNHLGLGEIPPNAAYLGRNGVPKYHDVDHIRKELEYTQRLFRDNPRWPVIEVTGKAIEETAAIVLRMLHERPDRERMPRISRRY